MKRAKLESTVARSKKMRDAMQKTMTGLRKKVQSGAARSNDEIEDTLRELRGSIAGHLTGIAEDAVWRDLLAAQPELSRIHGRLSAEHGRLQNLMKSLEEQAGGVGDLKPAFEHCLMMLNRVWQLEDQLMMEAGNLAFHKAG